MPSLKQASNVTTTMSLQFNYTHLSKLTLICTLAFVSFFATKVSAWGANGHRIVGAIAEHHLDADAKQQVSTILAGHSMARVSTWADEMRSSSDTFWQKQASPWHYINIDSVEEFTHQHFSAKEHKHDVKDAYTAILTAMKALRSPKTSQQQQQFYLRFLIHIIGDIHQPMHVGNAEDRGGNRIDVTFFREQTNLHRLWDTDLVESQKLSYSEYADFLCCVDTKAINKDLDIKKWLIESHHLAQDIYANTGEQVSYDYLFTYRPVMEQQLQRAGVRLAAVLNALYGQQ